MSGVIIVKVTNQLASTYLRLKVRRKEEQKNWTVKHNLWYWVRKEPPLTTDFYKLRWTPKFTDNQRITDTDTYIICKHIYGYMRSFLQKVLYTVWCLSKLYTQKSF
jgi:hypothetical protein